MPASDPISGEIWNAIKMGDLVRVTELIQTGRQWSESELNRFLDNAASYGHVFICRYLLENGAKVDTAPLSVQHLEITKAAPVLELFMEQGWKINDAVWYGHVLLPYTIHNEPLLRWLLDQGGDPNIGPSPGPEPLKFSEELGRNPMTDEEKAARVDQMTQELIEKASDAQKDSIRQMTLNKMDPQMLSRFQREGIDPLRLHYRTQAWKNVRQMDAPLPSHSYLVRRRDMPPYHGTGNALNSAASKSSIAIIDLLISYGAKLENSTALHHATESSDVDAQRIPVMKHLLELGADINARDDMRGNYATGTPLHSAIRDMKLERARFLLHEGADPHKTDKWGKTPLETAHPSGRENFVELFRGWIST